MSVTINTNPLRENPVILGATMFFSSLLAGSMVALEAHKLSVFLLKKYFGNLNTLNDNQQRIVKGVKFVGTLLGGIAGVAIGVIWTLGISGMSQDQLREHNRNMMLLQYMSRNGR